MIVFVYTFPFLHVFHGLDVHNKRPIEIESCAVLSIIEDLVSLAGIKVLAVWFVIGCRVSPVS